MAVSKLNRFGAVLAFAGRLEDAVRRFYVDRAALGERPDSFVALAEGSARRLALVQCACREMVNEMLLEPIEGLEAELPEVDAAPDGDTATMRNAALSLEAAAERFFRQSAERLGGVAPAASRLFSRLADENGARRRQLEADAVAAPLHARSQRTRRLILGTIAHARAGHTGGSLSATDILTVLYFHAMKIDPVNPTWPERDRFILSKGHSSPALYCTLAQRGYFPEERLREFDRADGMLQGHPCMLRTPGVDISTGSLGQGLSCGIGMALGGLAKGLDFHVYVLLGCGELQEGQVWEAAMYAGAHGLDRLTAIVDYNGVQLSGTVQEVLSVEPLAEKWRAFGWEVSECDGHSIPDLMDTLGCAAEVKGKPTLVIARTVKGKGVSFMENRCAWHGKAPSQEELAKALVEVGGDE